jgi:tRNA A37 threonylcarbamoyladenosine modification protein TsaB
LKNIVVVNGPWSFTGVRTIVLVVNTISFIIDNSKWNINLTPVSYFDLFDNYPIIKSSSKRDSFFKKSSLSNIEIIYNNELESLLQRENIKIIYGEWDIKNVEIIEKIDYCDIIKNINLKSFPRIEALYLKKPNIC